ncbi:UNVERIFIED_CONTAM: hypothetical protein HDU68_001648, partial [Siphonaria sp. JEL0065]
PTLPRSSLSWTLGFATKLVSVRLSKSFWPRPSSTRSVPSCSTHASNPTSLLKPLLTLRPSPSKS